MIHTDPRRRSPRILVDGLCAVVANDHLEHASMLDLSEHGLRIERMFDPAHAHPRVQLEIDLPGIDEVVWASAHITSARLTPLPGRRPDGEPRFWCRAGLRLDQLCRRERHLLRDYVRAVSAVASLAS